MKRDRVDFYALNGAQITGLPLNGSAQAMVGSVQHQKAVGNPIVVAACATLQPCYPFPGVDDHASIRPAAAA